MNSKRKGSAGERELLAILGQYADVHRNDQTFVGGRNNPDISMSWNGHRYHVEVKRVEKLNIHAAISQAEHDAGEEVIPIVVHRRNRENWHVTMRLQDFLSVSGGHHD